MDGYLAACHGKTAFPSRRAARRRARQIRGAGGPRANSEMCAHYRALRLQRANPQPTQGAPQP